MECREYGWTLLGGREARAIGARASLSREPVAGQWHAQLRQDVTADHEHDTRPIAVSPAAAARTRLLLSLDQDSLDQDYIVVLELCVELFDLAQARLENTNIKHGPARNNISRASTVRRRF